MNDKRFNRMISYEIDIRDKNREELIYELESADELKKQSKKTILMGATCLAVGAASAVVTGVFNSMGIDPSMMAVSGAATLAGFGLGGVELCNGVDKYNEWQERAEVLSLSKYVDADLAKKHGIKK